MKITAPAKWLDHVCRDLLLEEAIGDGWKPESGSYWYSHKDYAISIAIPDSSLSDYKNRTLEAIEGIAAVQGITAAEWFQTNLFLHAGGKLNM